MDGQDRSAGAGARLGFAALVAHDLRGPLRQVMDLAALAADTPDEAERTDLLEDVRGVAARAALLLDHFLALERASSGLAPLTDLAPLALGGPARAAAAHHEDEVASLNGAVTITGEARALGDGVLLEQVFRNLINNAVKYRGERAPRVAIELSTDEAFAQAVVTDHGLGVPKTMRESVFGAYVRDHRGAAQGHGVGLALCREVVRAHGGTIGMAEPAGAEATRIVLRLPAAPALTPR